MIANFIKKLFGSSKRTGTKEGTVKFFNYKKGFGFITLKDSEEEIFVHTTNLIDKIK
ncbi:MAG: cold shock domain-containing protein, partial [Winogradskyella sp.]